MFTDQINTRMVGKPEVSDLCSEKPTFSSLIGVRRQQISLSLLARLFGGNQLLGFFSKASNVTCPSCAQPFISSIETEVPFSLAGTDLHRR